MIRINKTGNIPPILSNEGTAETQNLENSYIANPNHYTSGMGLTARQIVKIEFDNRIYGDTTVKDQLIIEQHDKCCFCEGKFSDNSYGDVEHFRPKKAYKKRNSRSLTYPGYYWLAYEWSNLMYSCEKCNRSYKRNDFPLNTEATRKPNHAHANVLANEDCLLINPIAEDPSQFITFNEEVPVPVNGSQKGAMSIDNYGLERLNESRLDNLKAIKFAMILASINENDNAQVYLLAQQFGITSASLIESVLDARAVINSAAKDSAKFAYCVRCKYPNLPVN